LIKITLWDDGKFFIFEKLKEVVMMGFFFQLNEKNEDFYK